MPPPVTRMIRENGRDHSESNTRLLRRLIRTGRIVVDTERGLPLRSNGIPFATETNWCGYLRFRVRIKGKVRKWFFVHKAVHIARGGKIRKGYEVDHIDWNPANNRGDNLRYVSRAQNMANRKPEEEVEPAF